MTKSKLKLAKRRNLIYITILSLIVLFAAGFSAYENYLIKNHSKSESSVSTDPTASWVTYTNPKYNFSFKYPGNLGYQGNISGPATGTAIGYGSFTDSITIQTTPGSYFDGFSLYVVTDLKSASFDKYIAKEIAAMNAAKFTGMRNPTEVQLVSGVALVAKDGKQAYYYLPTTNQKELVVFAYLQANESFKQIFDQVLSTFKFDEATVSASPNF